MKVSRLLVILPVVLLSFPGCKKSATTQTSFSPIPQASAKPRFEACSLITKEEVGAIQAATILDAQSSTNFDGAYLVSLCYYSSRETNMSVSVAVTQPDPNNNSSDPKDYWKRTLGRSKDGEEEEEKAKGAEQGREKEHESAPPKVIAGVGDEAYWVGNAVGGALYVLKKNVIIRISVGGPGDEQAKLTKSKALAEKALSHL